MYNLNDLRPYLFEITQFANKMDRKPTRYGKTHDKCVGSVAVQLQNRYVLLSSSLHGEDLVFVLRGVVHVSDIVVDEQSLGWVGVCDLDNCVLGCCFY